VAALIQEQPDRTLAELQAALGTSACLATIWRTVKQLGFTLKKTVRASEQDRPDVAVARTAWRRVTPAIDPERFVFLDESGVATDLLRRYGRSQRGLRVHDLRATSSLADEHVRRGAAIRSNCGSPS